MDKLIKIQKAFLFPLLCFLSYGTAELPLFTPPASWNYVHPSKSSEYVLVSFKGKGLGPVHPTINLATEETEASLKDYVKAVKAIHLKTPGTKWRDLGPFHMKAGQGELTEISSKTPVGEVKVLQAIFTQNKTAYILTCSLLKKEFLELQKEVLTSFQSFSLEENLYTALSTEEKRTALHEIFTLLETPISEQASSKHKKNQSEFLQNQIQEKFPEMGGYWQVLAMKEGIAKILSQAN